MPENLVVAPAGSGVQVGADEVTLKGVPGVLVQYVKILSGTDNSVNPMAVDAAGNLQMILGGYGTLARCKSFPVTATAGALSGFLGTPHPNRKNIMIMNIGNASALLGDASVQAWPLDPYVPFVQDWSELIDSSLYLRAPGGTVTVVTLETA